MNGKVAKALRRQSVILEKNTNSEFVREITKKRKKVKIGGKGIKRLIDKITLKREKGTRGFIYKALKNQWNLTPRNARSIKAIPTMGL
jgi:hypothetical protein